MEKLSVKNGYVIIEVSCRRGDNKTGGGKEATISANYSALTCYGSFIL
jgi:hypothetical protein